MFSLGLLQMLVEPGRYRETSARALQWIRQAADAGAEIMLLPEALPFGWTDSSARKHAEPIPSGDWCRALSDAARRNHVWVCSGAIERDGNRIFNSAVLIDADGRVVLRHRKINELDIAHELYAQGDSLSVVDTRFGRIGVMICADAFAQGQVISRALGMMGAQVILSPCAWAVPADHDPHREPYGKLWLDNYGPVARDSALWIAGVSNVGPITDGPWKGRKCIGCSMVIDPEGKCVVQLDYGETAERMWKCSITPRERARACSGG
ncbi:MAG: carbon-nitrogen hydrolase family protein [Verrucomicrobia subdivision 3 bacterium]|nr:carbon-nitrogen hydrolase family protein [Limisphaerales bacterium]